jgi:hypothetical protein
MRTTILTMTQEEIDQMMQRLDDEGVIEAITLEGLHGIHAIEAAKAEILSRKPRWIRPLWIFNDCSLEAA